MNTIERIIAKSKTQKAAAEEILALATKLGQPIADPTKYVKEFKHGSPYTNQITDSLLRLEKIYNREQTRQWLNRKQPMDMLNKAVEKQEKNLAEWFDKAKADPFHQLSWGGTAFQGAAKLKVLKEIEDHLIGNVNQERWDAIMESLRKDVLRMASSMNNSRSTSQTSNLAEDCLMAAKAEILDHNWGVTSEIEYWFREKAKLEAEETE